MSWEARLSSLLAQADCGVARAKQRLSMANVPSKADFQPDRMSPAKAAFEGRQPCPACTGLPLGSAAAERLAAVTRQLRSQTKIIELLTQSVNQLKQEKEFQQQRISNLEEDVQRLQNSSYSNVETLLRRIDELKSKHHKQQQQEFRQPHADCGAHLNPWANRPGEMKVNSEKLLWQDHVCMRKELEQLKHKVDQQEEELLNQMSAADAIKRAQSRCSMAGSFIITPLASGLGWFNILWQTWCRNEQALPAEENTVFLSVENSEFTVLEDLLTSHKKHSCSLDQHRMELQSTQQELSHIRSAVADLKDQVKSWFLKEMPSTELIEKHSIHWKRSKDLLGEAEDFSPSTDEDSTSELSLKGLNSDELSSTLEIKVPEDSQDISTVCCELEESDAGEEAGDVLDAGDDLGSDLSACLPELQLSDL